MCTYIATFFYSTHLYIHILFIEFFTGLLLVGNFGANLIYLIQGIPVNKFKVLGNNVHTRTHIYYVTNNAFKMLGLVAHDFYIFGKYRHLFIDVLGRLNILNISSQCENPYCVR